MTKLNTNTILMVIVIFIIITIVYCKYSSGLDSNSGTCAQTDERILKSCGRLLVTFLSSMRLFFQNVMDTLWTAIVFSGIDPEKEPFIITLHNFTNLIGETINIISPTSNISTVTANMVEIIKSLFMIGDPKFSPQVSSAIQNDKALNYMIFGTMPDGGQGGLGLNGYCSKFISEIESIWCYTVPKSFSVAFSSPEHI